jgi:8-oxo-dGTP diphosphatase
VATAKATTTKLAGKKRGPARAAHWVPVVAALIKRQGKVLVGQRPEGGALARSWEFPGGKIELGESPKEALERELKEELGIEAEIGDLVFAGTHTYDQTGMLFLFFEVRFWKGQLKEQQHLELKWVQPKELTQLDLPAANRQFLPSLLESL